MQKVIAFDGVYADMLYDYIAFRQSLGFVMPASSQRCLVRMAKYLYSLPLVPGVIDLERAEGIASKHSGESEQTRQARYVVLRQLCLYLNRIGIDAYIPPAGGVRARTSFVPRIVSEDEMATIIEVAEAQALRWPAIVLKILWCTGIRIGEAAALKVGDFRPDQRSLYIAHAKYDRSRIIPVCRSFADDLKDYIECNVPDRRPEAWLLPGKEPGEHRNKVAISNRLRSIYRTAGVLTDTGSPIRTHDVRHSFAVKALENMVKRGEDVYVVLPLLSAYMGHANIFDTEYYLRLLPSEHQRIIDKECEVSHTVFGGDSI
jgi:integrase